MSAVTIRITREAHAALVERARAEGRTLKSVVDRLVGVGVAGGSIAEKIAPRGVSAREGLRYVPDGDE